jgi:peptidoglycan LD-endopeptidase CwlK
MDAPTELKIKLLHPIIRDEVFSLVTELDTLLSGKAKMRIVQGLRTIEEQNALYAKGRTAPGKIVTNAKGGSSYHNYGIAIDFAFLIDGKEISWDINKDWDDDKISDWTEVVNLFVKNGYSWGGNWKSLKDYPHFEKTFGLNWRELLSRYNNRDFIPGTKYVRI